MKKICFKGSLISANSSNCRIRCNYFFGDTFVTFMSYGPPKDFIIKYHEDGFGDDEDDDGDDDGGGDNDDDGHDDDFVKL